MFNFFKPLSLSIDLGTANTLIFMDGEIVLNEPSVVAIHHERGATEATVIAVGQDAKDMLGRTPSSIEAIRPMKDGVIADFKITEKMLQHFIRKVSHGGFFSPSPKVLICVPCGATQVERRAIKESAIGAGARDVYLIEEPMAAALGAGMAIKEASGTMVVDIGGGTTEIAIMSLNGLVYSDSLRIGGDVLDDNIIKFVRREYGIIIGESTAEKIKEELGSAFETNVIKKMEFKGRDIAKGIPVSFEVSNTKIREAIQEPLLSIVSAVRIALEQTPPELSADISENGLVLTGGGALLEGFDKLISKETNLPVRIADNPLTCVARGGGIVLDMISQHEIGFLSAE
ncbi:Rod shape-determining protein MreB [uncultured Gammaproteobacteria bacterium]|jgi:rod shape-determining protein MreB|uniref:Cell shape-determining protein MreB n=3 Tax=sulfur-oxidizing symbionts TaxID=32036 RepID=A0A1H6J6T7_9GAMM|nr:MULTISPECIES: rod shape-determining protein [sulfur-oxidizing symbionts]CAC5853837.1 Rod shape-determining protein MreB [uncultured Gammaproteobacteria bacterium]CAB5495596.1 Rod shape-determining protein MreB [Bathymodiolus azoricus thioautotrophic gill symbiont]CAB5500485.1 Rod shape-determining protein MreB [Bathymodiolus thermophilus thioautotrophic gill symbiont]CAC9499078.1 Rod shape-determining protein MreB [uncultured Gammaproteobacteria bacterium]CAC9501254.1 Rod shape-determining 